MHIFCCICKWSKRGSTIRFTLSWTGMDLTVWGPWAQVLVGALFLSPKEKKTSWVWSGPSSATSGLSLILMSFWLIWIEHGTLYHSLVYWSWLWLAEFWLYKSFCNFWIVEAFSNRIKAKLIPAELPRGVPSIGAGFSGKLLIVHYYVKISALFWINKGNLRCNHLPK